jgi:hypothetical protein
LTGCTNPYDPGQRAVGGGLLGAGAGAALGGLVGGGHGAAIGALAGGALVLQLRIVPVSIVGAPGLFVVLDAPREPLPKQLARLWSQENSAGEDMTDGVHGHTKLW